MCQMQKCSPKSVAPELWLSDILSSLPLFFGKVLSGSRMPLYVQSKDKKIVFLDI
jgi:hypothetical protein